MSGVPAALWENLIAVQIYGANTGVGKTVFSTLLGAHFARRSGRTKWKVEYVKPVSTGPSNEADHRYVRRFTGQSVSTLFQFNDPVSPHIAARAAASIPSNEHVIQSLYSHLKKAASNMKSDNNDSGVALVETAGGVLSPGPSGTPQADIFRPMRLPAVLVGDHRLGGIASTISAAESLITRGYDIDTVVCFDDKGRYENAAYLKEYFQNMGILAVSVPWLPDLEGIDEKEELSRMTLYYQSTSLGSELHQIASRIITSHTKRLETVKSMALRTKESIWHPFTQHKHVKSADDVLVFDSAYGDHFQVKHTSASLPSLQSEEGVQPILYPAFDGSASWWTQGLGHGNPKLALQAAYAAGRYGHVMFAGATHEPAITLAERMLNGLDNPRLQKIFYTDNGSTATEVGIKMALRASCKRYRWDSASEEIGVLGLKGSYHGDTIGAMDASEPCVFNEKVDWYRGRGYWFDYPTFKLKKGRWVIEPPKNMENELGPDQFFDGMDDIFNLDTRGASSQYEAYIEKTLDVLVRDKGKKFGALVMEPVILGAGGMLFVDPLFQQSLVRVVRRYNFSTTATITPASDTDVNAWTGLPVMFDEVFTGLYRLGRFSSASFLDVHPDISVHAKLLTGGLLPLSITAASNAIYGAFLGDEKSEALLHGHSYTAHPIGCHIANVSLQTMEGLNTVDDAWKGYKTSWQLSNQEKRGNGGVTNDRLWSMWSQKFVHQLSEHGSVEHVNALGSVLAVSLVDKSGSGYTSSAATGLRDALLNQSSIHSRILGNVIYLMASMTSKPQQLATIESALVKQLNHVESA
ncbi:pyridoxal phosphate-dependent transferase [Phaeosphaeriaceae sp. PMI808]|nr:pyridoxal phosphate-dependent transferase [Phaeosphaeriaceae sp. PMI808]